jgi:hypothetical protein
VGGEANSRPLAMDSYLPLYFRDVSITTLGDYYGLFGVPIRGPHQWANPELFEALGHILSGFSERAHGSVKKSIRRVKRGCAKVLFRPGKPHPLGKDSLHGSVNALTLDRSKFDVF